MNAPLRAFGRAALPGTWIGADTPVATHRGPVAGRHLRPGDPVVTPEGFARVRAVAAADLGAAHFGASALEARGGQAPVLLRAPYFAARCDLLVSPGQPVVLRGTLVEYLFGEEAVQAEARLLVDGRTALEAVEDRLAVISLELDRAGAILADGCALAMPGPRGAALRSLCAYEVAEVLAQRRGGLCA